jgi:hypothetical protein
MLGSVRALLVIGVSVIVLLGSSTLAAAPSFPQAIVYKVVGGPAIGQATLQFAQGSPQEIDGDVGGQAVPLYLLKMSNFQGLGYKSDETLITWVKQRDLSFFGTMAVRGKRPSYEIRTVKRFDMANKKRLAFAYKGPGDTATIDTMLYSDHPVVDLLSLLLHVAQKAKDNDSKQEQLNLFVGKSTRIVGLERKGSVKAPYGDRYVNATRFLLTHDGRSIFTLDVTKENGVYFPTQVVLDDDSGKDIRLVADKIIP